MYNSNTDSLGLILGVEVFFSLGHCSGALCGRITEKDLDGTDYFENGQSVYLGKGCWGHET